MPLNNKRPSSSERENFPNVDARFMCGLPYHANPGDGWVVFPLICYHGPLLSRNNSLPAGWLLRDTDCQGIFNWPYNMKETWAQSSFLHSSFEVLRGMCQLPAHCPQARFSTVPQRSMAPDVHRSTRYANAFMSLDRRLRRSRLVSLARRMAHYV